MKVATAHHDRIVRQALKRSLTHSHFELLWHATSLEELLRRQLREPPALLLVELEMLGTKAERLPELLRDGSAVVVLASAGVVGAAYEALGQGALGLLEPPGISEAGELEGAQRMRERLDRLALLVEPAQQAKTPTVVRGGSRRAPIIALGASTGGPLALATVLKNLPVALEAAVLIVQHIESEFAAGLAQWLGSQCAFPVSVPERGETPQAGRIYVAGPGGHLVLLGSQQFSTLAPLPGELHVPSVDAMFKSLAEHAAPGVAALMTGMGHDGVEGLLQLRRCGWLTMAQDEASSVVYGMPRAAVEIGAVQQVLPLSAIGPALARHFAGTGRA